MTAPTPHDRQTALAPPFAYFGGKTSMATRIVSLLPAHGHYVEPFAGSLSVLLAKPPSVHETVNDLDAALVTFWRVLRDRPDDLVRACFLTPHSRSEFAACRDDEAPGLDELEIARRVWVQLSQGRNGTRRTTGTGWRNQISTTVGKSVPEYLATYVQRMFPLAERLRHVTLESRPALDLIARYGGDTDVLLYCDPPYLATTRGWGINYRHEMRADDEHRELADALHACRASVVLSGYSSPLYDEIYGGWARTELRAFTGQSTDGRRVEVLWSNRPFDIDQGVLDFGAAG